MRFLARSFLLLAITVSLLGNHTTAVGQMGGGMGQGGIVAGGAHTGVTQPVAPVDISAEIRQLRRSHAMAANPGRSIDVTESPAQPTINLSPTRQRFSQLLSQKNSFDFLDTPLAEVADWLKQQLGCPVVLDRQAIWDEAIDPVSDGVTFAAKEMTYQSALYHMLGELNLTYTIAHEVLMITSAEKAEETLETQVYPVWDLAGSGRAEEPTERDYDSLIEVITTSISPNSWEDVGGPGCIYAYKGMITVTNSQAVHDEIAKLLTALRNFSASLSEVDSPRAAMAIIDLSNSPTKDAAAKLLSKSMPFQFLDTPLNEVVDWIRDQSPINVLLDRRGLEDAGIDPSSETITMDVTGVSVQTGLNLILTDLNLTHVVDHEALVVTSRDTAEDTLRTKIYPCVAVIDIVDPKNLQQIRDELEQLAETISNSVSVESWDSVGGPGSISSFPARGLLAIRQTDEVHGGIEALLSKLRRGRTGSRVPKPSTGTIQVRSYRLSSEFAKNEARSQLIFLIRRLLQDTDNAVNTPATGFTVEGLAGSLVISHRRDAQEPIRRLLEKLGALAQATQPMRVGTF